MNKFFRRIYLMGILVALFATIAILLQYQISDQTMEEQIKKNIELKMDYTSYKIHNSYLENINSLKNIEQMLASNSTDERLLMHLKNSLESSSSLISLYYGTTDNKMLNGSGWIPPESFDLRTRPWYIKAVEEEKLIITPLYLNASKDTWIVTIAKPIYNKDNTLIGVVAGDKSLANVLATLKDTNITENSYTFFFDSNKELIMNSNYDTLNIDKINLDEESEELKNIIDKEDGLILINLSGVDGYLSWNTIVDTGWIVGSFVPLDDFDFVGAQLTSVFTHVFAFLLVFFILLFILQKKYFVNPIKKLDDDIKKISIGKNTEYRLSTIDKDTFLDIRNTINSVLSQVQISLETININHMELQESHSELLVSRNALKVSESKNKAIINLLPDLVFIFDKDGYFKNYLSTSKTTLMDENEFLQKNISEIMPESVSKLSIEFIRKAILTKELQRFEYILNTQKGKEYFEARMISMNKDEVLTIIRNISDQKEMLSKVEVLSYNDQLTGLYNRRYFESKMKQIDSEQKYPLTIVMIDVNGLKLTNDAFGHFEGDKLLKQVAATLKEHSRKSDIVSRIGGDEFVILLPRTDEESAKNIVKNIYKSISKRILNNAPISISIGYSTKTNQTQLINDIFAKAEDDMYRNKLTESQSTRNQTIKVILKTLNEKNSREKKHSDQVSKISKKIGNALNLSHERINEIVSAGLMHDIGKIAINESILDKPSALTNAEYDEIKRHPEVGYQILKSVDKYTSLAEYVLSHHERWDGKGYPRGLKEKETPLISRILGIADAYEAMISDRAYRKALGKEKAIEEIKNNSGTQFDPELVKIFLIAFDN